MYTTCLYCHADLGRNESVELFPVGRRLAFDQAKGRLWVICTRCARWNLSPLDARWEAIESLERLYHDTPKRAATDQIGLAKVGDGATIVRIGAPVFPEYASWRYGHRFVQRRSRYLVLTGAAAVGGLAAFFGGPTLMAALFGAGSGGGWVFYQVVSALAGHRQARRRLGSFSLPDGETRMVRGSEAAQARLITEVPSGFRVEVDGLTERTQPGGELQRVKFEGASARHFLRLALPHVNNEGATVRTVEEATYLLGLNQGPADPIGAAHRELVNKGHGYTLLRELPVPLRIGLEMAVMEGQERQWLETELSLLSAAWKEAEELAAIADSLTIPVWLEEQVARMKGSAPVDR